MLVTPGHRRNHTVGYRRYNKIYEKKVDETLQVVDIKPEDTLSSPQGKEQRQFDTISSQPPRTGTHDHNSRNVNPLEASNSGSRFALLSEEQINEDKLVEV